MAIPIRKVLASPKPRRRQRKPETEPPACFADLDDDDQRKLKLWCKEHTPQFAHRHPGGFYSLMEICLDWHRANDIWRRDWSATMRNWLRNAATFAAERRQRYPDEKPQQRRGRSGDRKPTDLKDTLGGLFEHLEETE